MSFQTSTRLHILMQWFGIEELVPALILLAADNVLALAVLHQHRRRQPRTLKQERNDFEYPRIDNRISNPDDHLHL